MTDIRAKGFDNPAQLREHLDELEEESPAEDLGGGNENPSSQQQIEALR